MKTRKIDYVRCVDCKYWRDLEESFYNGYKKAPNICLDCFPYNPVCLISMKKRKNFVEGRND